MNLLILSGWVASDKIIPRFTQTGKPVVSFALAVRKSYTKDADGKYPTSFLYIEAWNRLAETCEQFLLKGSRVMVRGHVVDDQYVDKEGKKQYRTKLVADIIEFVKQGTPSDGGSDAENFNDDDIPF